MPRLVRRKPFAERLKAMLNPMDFLLWLSEELETRDWDSKVVGTQLGVGVNFVFLLARANSGTTTPSDDIFSDDAGSGWLSFFVSLPKHLCALLHVLTVCLLRSILWFGASSPSPASMPSTR